MKVVDHVSEFMEDVLEFVKPANPEFLVICTAFYRSGDDAETRAGKYIFNTGLMEHDGKPTDHFKKGSIRIFDFNQGFLSLAEKNVVNCKYRDDLTHYNAFAMSAWANELNRKLTQWYNV